LLLSLCLLLLLGSAALALALAAARSPAAAQVTATAGAVIACALGFVPVVRSLAGAPPESMELPWAAPLGPIHLGLDPLSAFFLAPLLVLGALAAVYGRAYLAHARGPGSPAIAGATLNALLASMVVVVVARGALVFLVAWEAMTLTSYLLVVFDHHEEDVRRAGWVYLIAAHVGVACLLAFFLMLEPSGGAGGLDFDQLAAGARTLAPGALFTATLLAGIGFGVKAGVVPLHVWLPEAHAAAPSHVSALMSGVLVKLGLYGLLRAGLLLQPPSAWGHALLALGVGGALLGILLALQQRDLKRVLAYSTVENVGIVLIGLGLCTWARGHGHPEAAALALAGALLHVWNHAAMKGLMFLCAGGVVHQVGTRDLEKMGGLLRRMPATGMMALLGAAALSALPPLNGFTGELLLYLGLGKVALAAPGWTGAAAALGIGALALVGGLAALTFLRLAGIAFLGEPRSAEASRATEPSNWMTWPMVALTAALVLGGIGPGTVARALWPAAAQVLGPELATAEPPAGLHAVGGAALAIWLTVALLWLLLRVLARGAPQLVGTWDCGYAEPTPRMQYTARSFSEHLLSRLLPPWLRPSTHRPSLAGRPFPAPARFSTESEDPVTRRAYRPFLASGAERVSRIRWMQQGLLPVYVVYILATVVLALGWLSIRQWIQP
jgi:formate hydrogenlyase subunit 3/multisubunit Na+/H+ antiporter MnhD subunit